MKKLVSLLLAVMLVMSMMTFNVMASTDTLLAIANTQKKEDDFESGTSLGTTAVYGYYAKYQPSSGVTIASISDENTSNKIFKIEGSYQGDNGSSLVALRPSKLYNTSYLNRFEANIMLPNVTDINAITGVHQPHSAWTATSGDYDGYGVFLTNGGAQYYDMAKNEHVYFIPQNTMQANKWYTIETIMDTREATTSTSTSKVYMNAFVYDTDTKELIGTSGWQYVTNYNIYTNEKTFRNTYIQAGKFDVGSYVCVDNYNAYSISNLPEYTLSGSVIKSGPVNYYLGTDSSSSYRSIMEVFNGYNHGAVVTDSTENKAARMQFDIRIPEIATTDVMNFFGLYSGKNGGESPCIYTNGNANFEGAAHLENGALTIRSYDAANGVYANTVATGTINANEWYTFTYDVDYTDIEAPKGTLTVTDEDDTVVLTASDFAAQPIPQNSYGQWTNVALYTDSSYKNKIYHIDNMGLYAATTLANLNDIAARTEVFLHEFDDWTLGDNFGDAMQEKHAFKTMPSGWELAAAVTEDKFVWEDGVVLQSTDPFALTFNYSNPVPVANINTNNIELYADGVKMATGYTVAAGTSDSNNCATEFTVTANSLDWGIDYIIRIKAGVSDYNTALSGGVAADAGLYKDYTFSVVSLKPDCEITGEFIEGDGTVAGKVTFTSSEDSPLTCYAILAIYQGDKLVGLKKSAEIAVPANAVAYEATVDAVSFPAGAKAKIFVWNNFETMRPWVNPIVLGE